MVPIEEAVSQNSIEEVQRLIDSGVDLNAQGTFPLHTAVDIGNEKIAELLILNGAVIDSKDFDELTPLYSTVNTLQ